MAKAALVHKKTMTDVIKFSGVVSEDGTTVNLDGVDKNILELFKEFAGRNIDGSITEKNEEEI
jgi:hypothetical protein